jgi:CheY-like chemotaxis protein
VLIVDDESDTLEFLSAVLGNCGATVIGVTSAADALRVIEETKPDLLISDIGMPDEDGYALIRKVRRLGGRRGEQIPAIALTAYAREEDRMRAFREGYQMHLAKPVDPTQLTTIVASFTGRSQIG